MKLDVKKYLERININSIQPASDSFLAQLQLNHLIAVPFENLDIRQGIKIVLDDTRFFEKIIHRRRGGFCYELNGLFRRLLAELGFSVSIASGRVYIAADDRFTPEFDHMVLLVQMDKIYLVDVGFGDCFRKPIALPGGLVEDISGTYRIKPPGLDQDIYLLQRRDKGMWHPRKLSDFSEMCAFNQTSPNSHFTQQTVCSVATETGRATLTDDFLTITEGDHQKKVPVDSPEIFQQLLAEIFEISIDGFLSQ